jgi:addiction module RelE/StbE family toxin
MNVLFHNNFKKHYRKLSKNVQRRTDERLVLFRQDPFNALLNNHGLFGKYLGCRSINITGDLRAIYRALGDNTAFFIEIGTHGNLYE